MHRKNTRPKSRFRNNCPVHGTRLDKKLYEDLDLLVMKCQEENCTAGHGMIEHFNEKKKKRNKFTSTQVQEALEKAADEQSKLQTQQ